MKTTIEVVLVILLLVFNCILGGFFLFNIQIFSAPETTITLDVLELTKDSIVFQSHLRIKNDNPAAIILEDITIRGTTSTGELLIDTAIDGGIVPAYENQSFSLTDDLTFSNQLDSTIQAEITGTIGIQLLGFITKTIPLKATIIATFDELIQSVQPPSLSLAAQIVDVTSEGVELEATLDVENPNPFDIILNNLETHISTNTHDYITSLTTIDGIIHQEETMTFTINGNVPYSVFNASVILLHAQGNIGAHVAGLQETIPIELEAEMQVPDIADLLFQDDTMDFSVSGEFKLRFRGVVTTIGFKVYNPSNIPLETQDLHCSILGLTGEDQYKTIVEKPMENCEIPSKQEVCVTTEIILPYLKLLTSGTHRLFPTWFVLRIEGNLTIAETGQYIPISINGYVDPHLFR